MTPLGLGLGLGLGRQGSGGESPDMILVYAIPDPNTDIKLAIQANSTWFSAEQAAVIDWGDGSAAETVSATSAHTGYVGHTYASAGTYTIKISGSMTMYGRGAHTVALNGQQLLTHIHSFGELGITSFAFAFNGCSGILSAPKTLPDSVRDMRYMFYNCNAPTFNPDVSAWNVSNVTNMNRMFRYCNGPAFNPDVSNWNVSNVTDMVYMFGNCNGAAFRGGRGVGGVGIANWRLKTGVNAVLITDFMASSNTQEPEFLDDILNAWAALHAEGQLPTKITVSFGNNKYTADGADAYTTLTTITGSGGAEWTILSGGLQS